MHLRSSAPELAEAWAAFDRGAAEEAIAHFDALPGNPDALYGIAQSRWFLGDIDAGVRLAEEAYVAFREAGEGARAADVALWLAIEYVNSYWNPAVANGWFRRGERLLADCAPCAATVELGVQRARRAGSPEETVRIFEEALALARELGDIGSELRALSAFGGYKVGAGDDEEGFALLDEAMAAAMGGETRDPWAIGSACCALLGVCDQMGDLDRAAQWCRTGLDVVRRERCLPLFAWCRSAYAGVLIATGDWERAEKELQESLRAYGGPGRPMATYPLARLAELRLRQGRLEEAAALVAGIESNARAALVAIEIQLARGQAASARAALGPRVEATPEGHAGEVALLPLLARAQLMDDELDGAFETSERLVRTARALGRESAIGIAELVAGRVALARAESATGHLEAALDVFQRMGMPLEEGRARLELARALGEASPERAGEEARRALAVFERLGARLDADAAAALLRAAGGAGRSAPRMEGALTARELEVLDLLGAGLSNAAIAERLVISTRTAEHHVARILRKLGVTSRAEAAVQAIRIRSADR